ncbi:uncharacterized protein LOC122577697 [Bombus pyrosoma]|uniref:uncharacterized protein LOC122577697 n=1 Tax=Bombus pyrosoma TaxID=396416 RepID=UPI001CB97134|nr:uncharacterized protein LOC122577697 [Bombus pyrosoma]
MESTTQFRTYNKEILRLVMIEQLSIVVIHMCFENGDVTIKSTTTVKFRKICHEENQLLHLVGHLIPPDEILIPFTKRFSEFLNIDVHSVTESIDNIFSSTCDIVLDFDLQKLTQLSKKRDATIKDIITEMFWLPKMNSKLGNGSWFDSVDRGHVVPFYMTCCDELSDFIGDYLNYFRVIEQSSKKIIKWYFLDINIFLTQDTDLLYKKMEQEKRNKQTRNLTILKKINRDTTHHMVHVIRYYSKECKLEDDSIVDLLRNPFLPTDRLPFITQSYDPRISKYVFHMVYKDNIEITNENFFNLLSMLREILLKLNIGSIVIQNCDFFNLQNVLNMIEYILCKEDIAVTIAGM